MDKFFDWITWIMSLPIEWIVLIIACASALMLVTVIIVVIAVCVKRRNRQRLFKQEKEEREKRALQEFMSDGKDTVPEIEEVDIITSTEIEEVSIQTDVETEEVYIGEDRERTNEVSSKPVIDEDSAQSEDKIGEDLCEEKADELITTVRISKKDNLDTAFEHEHDEVERTEETEYGFVEDIERAEVDIVDNNAEENIGNSVFDFANGADKKPIVGFDEKLVKADSAVKANYCDVVNYALSYKKVKARKSALSEKFYSGSNLLFMLKINGKSLRAYYALRIADYEDTTMPVTDESDKKSYEKTPVMLKISSPLSLKRAKMLIDDVMTRFACEKGKEKTVITVDEL